MVYCTYCGQSFTRDEHLERHILTHTNVKPFKCFSCHMSFARRDLLQRHYTVHGKDQNNQEIVPAANGMIPKSAGRTPIACTNCAKTKTKCDKKFPCSRCEARNLLCTVRPTRRSIKNGPRVDVSSEKMEQDGVVKTSKEMEQSDAPLRLNLLHSKTSSETNGGQQQKVDVPAVDGPPSNQFDHPTSGPNRNRPSIMATPITSPAHFVQHTPLSTFEDLSHMTCDESDLDSSPKFMLDWSQMQMPLGFEGVVEPQMLLNTHNAGFHPSVLPVAPSSGGMLGIIPHLGHSIAPALITPPMEMPKAVRQFNPVDYHCPPARRSRNSSLSTSRGDVRGEMSAIIAARDSWTCFRCCPTVPSISCPKTARLNLERLEQTLKNHDGWSTWSPQWDEAEFAGGDQLTVMQLHESTRDKLLAITQSFLHKALEIHREVSAASDQGSHSPSSGVSNFVLLPPARVLEYFLRSYANCFEHYYPLTSRASLDANELMHCYNDRAASLLVLMMIAQGAMNIPSVEARMLTGGLTEACRISLFDLIEKNIIMAGDPIVLHSALIFTVQAAWSGDKWQMDIAMGQRGMYLAMLRHSGFLDEPPQTPFTQETRINADHQWHQWIQSESRSRLVYSWAMVDQELSLFHDTTPLFSVTELDASMPDDDRLWHSRSAAEWSTVFGQLHELSAYSAIEFDFRPLSLHQLFQHFLDDELTAMDVEMTPLQLRLLLHPVQSLISQCNQLLSCYSHPPSNQSTEPQGPTFDSTRVHLRQMQALLQRWYILAQRYLNTHPTCAMMQTNLVLFHLISLNTVTDFPRIEQRAREDGADGTYHRVLWFHKRCIRDVEEAIYHCGQIMRLVRTMPRGVRPPWWAGAVYRVAIVLWGTAMMRKDPARPQNSAMFPVPGPSIPMDALPADHTLISRYLTKREGVPCVTRRDGSQMGMEKPIRVLEHCIEFIDDGAATRFSDGIRAKLERLAKL